MICAIHFLASRSVRSKFLCYKCTMVGRTLEFIRNHPLARGVLTYSILWPTANLIHQSRTSKEKFNYPAAIRYGLVGVTFVLPVYFTWLKVINRVMPGSDWKACVKKVICEQTMYWPIAIPVFFGGMNFYEGQSFEHYKAELQEKYVKTHLTGLCFFPFVAPIINYSNLVSDRNRIVIAACASFVWASFLSYIKSLEVQSSRKEKA